MVQDHADHNAVWIFGIEHDMRLEPKPPVPGRDIAHAGTDPRKIRQQIERALKARVIGVGLVRTEGAVRIVVDIKQISLGTG